MSSILPIGPAARVAGPYTATEGQTSFPYAFALIDPADLKVETATAAAPDTWTTQTLDLHYTLSPAPPVSAGGNVLFSIGRAAGSRVRITGDAVIANTTDPLPGGMVDSARLNRFFDRVTIWAQEGRQRDGDDRSYINGLDAQNVKLTGDQIIAGMKSFADARVSVPLHADSPVNKAYVDEKVIDGGGGLQAATAEETTDGVSNLVGITPLRLTQRLREEGFLTPSLLGITLGGTTDRASQVQTAIDAIAADGGGRILIPAGERIFLGSDVNFWEHTGLVSLDRGTASLAIVDTGPTWLDKGAGVDMDGGVLRLWDGAALSNLMLISADAKRNAPTTFAEADAWAGHAVQLVGGNGGQVIEDCSIMGFLRAVISVAGGPPYNFLYGGQTLIQGNRIDCKHGIYIQSDGDVPRLLHNHCWPYLSWAGGASQEDAIRLGTAFQLHTGNAGALMEGCASFGHLFGVYAESSIRIINCGIDFWTDLSKTGEVGAGAVAYVFEGQVETPTMIGCLASGHDVGVLFNPNDPSYHLSMYGCYLWSHRTGAQVQSGGALIDGGSIYGGKSGVTSTGLSVVSTTGTLARDVKFTGLDSGIVSIAGQPTRQRGCTFGNCTTHFTNPYLATVASASALDINSVDKYYVVTGSNTIASILRATDHAGDVVRLYFVATPTVQHSSAIALQASANFVAAASNVLTLLSTGTTWVEVSRKTG